jgi:hypothetical protein
VSIATGNESGRPNVLSMSTAIGGGAMREEDRLEILFWWEGEDVRGGGGDGEGADADRDGGEDGPVPIRRRRAWSARPETRRAAGPV